MSDFVEGFLELPELAPFPLLPGLGFDREFVKPVVESELTRGGEGSDGDLSPALILDEKVPDFKL